jgi:HD-GYP domain-containing protein (c-di-GMP phosphodiesterase class II)
VVNLADSFDAMTTDRPYRRRRPATEVFDDLQRNAGKQFAPEIVAAFFRGMLKELTGEGKEKKFRKLLGREYMETEHLALLLKRSLNSMTPTSSLTMLNSD